MAQYAMITETGLNEIDNAHPLGQYIEIAYYLPVYDYRIDPNILPTDTSISGTEIRTCTSSADTVPQGEILWNVSGDSYTLSPEQLYLIRTGDELVTTSGTNKQITNFAHREVFSINKFKTSAIGDYYTGDTVSSPGTAGASWFISNAGYGLLSAPTSAEGFGPEDPDSPAASFLYKGVTYQHVITSANDSRANFKVTMRAEHGQIKFNKVGLYGVKRTADGVIATDPFLFGQVIIPEPQILYSRDVGSTGKVTEITLDYQIESKTLSAGLFEDVFYSTSGDYWVRTTNEENGNYGLSYDGSVYISNTLGIDETGQVLPGDDDRSVAKLLVSTFEYVNKPVTSAEREMPQLCLQYVASQGIESKRIRTTMKTNVSGDCEFDMYGACLSAHPDNYSLIPAIDKGYGLGLEGKRWSHAYISNTFEMFNDSWADVTSGSNFLDSYINFDSSNALAHFGSTNVYVGPYHNTKQIKFDGSTFLKKINNTRYMHGNISSYRASATGNDIITGVENIYTQEYDLLIRGLNDIALVTLSAGSESSFTAEEIIDKIWTTYTITEAEIDRLKKLITANEISIDVINGDIAQFTTSTPVGLIQERNQLTFENEKLASQIKTLEESGENINTYLGESQDILLVAGRNIHTNGNVIPLRNLVNDLGWWDNQFAHVFTENITGWNRDDGNGRQVTFQGHIVPDGTGHKIRENKWTGWEWSEITAKKFGRTDKYVEKAYLRKIYTRDIRIEENGSLEFTNGIKMSNSSIWGNINNIGTDTNPVNIIYVNDLVLKNQYKTYTVGDLLTPKSTSIYSSNFKSAGGSFKFKNVTARYSAIQQGGILYLTFEKDQSIADASSNWNPNDIPGKKDMVTIPYSGMMQIFGFNTMQYVDSTPITLQQYVHSNEDGIGGKDEGNFKFAGTIFQAPDDIGFVVAGKYRTLTNPSDGSSKRFWKFLAGNKVSIRDTDIVLTFKFTGVLTSVWSEQ